MVLFIGDHSDATRLEAEALCNARGLSFGGVITSIDQTLDLSLSYCISTNDVGIDYVSSLLTKFKDIEFLENHRDPHVKESQKELKAELNGIQREIITLDDRLHFFGDSHTYGQGHNDIKNVFPYVLSHMLGMECNNLGLPGKSNYCIEHRMNDFLIKSSKVIVQFTDIYRIHYLDGSNLKPTGKSFYYVRNMLSSSVMFDEEHLFYNFQKLVIRIVNRLKETESKFLLTYACHINDNMDSRCNRFLNQFDEFVPQIGTHVDAAEDGSHFGIQSHKLWAERLYDRWKSLYGDSYQA